MINMSRREFILLASMLGLNSAINAGHFLGAYLKKDKYITPETYNPIKNTENKRVLKNNIESLIYNELPKHVHPIKVIKDIYFEDKKITKLQNFGCGIVMNNKYITLAHINNFEINKKIAPNIGGKLFNSKNKRAILYGKELEELISDKKEDIAVYSIPKNLKLQNFPAKINKNIKLGDDVYLISKSNMLGANVRKGEIFDLDGLESLPVSNNWFGVDIPVIPGDSGSPIINSNYELLGICVALSMGNLGYVKKIERFLDYI